jgi:hypothetical protein
MGLALRLSDPKDSHIEKAVENGTILRTYLLRPTWHFVHAQDLQWLLLLSASRVQAVNAIMYKQLELDSTLLSCCNDILYQCLSGGKQITRAQIGKLLLTKQIRAKGMRLAYIMMHAELEGLVCSGKPTGNSFTYQLVEERVKVSKPLSREEALFELTKRYFQSRGPATLYDFSTWSGLTLADCKQGLTLLQNRVKTFTMDCLAYYYISLEDSRPLPDALYLLPIYDEMIMGYKNRQALFKDIPLPLNKLKYNCMILYKDQVIGTYKRVLQGKKAHFSFDYFIPLPVHRQNKVNQQLEYFEAFTGLTTSSH